MDEIEFMIMATRLGCPSPGLVLSDERAFEMAHHSRTVFQKFGKYGVKIDGRSIPRLKPNSHFNWCPVITTVCTFPIDEDEDYDEDVHGKLDKARPLFYSEIDAVHLNELKKRVRFQQQQKKERRRGRRANASKLRFKASTGDSPPRIAARIADIA